ncbi:MAG TPA: CO dehydrogenase/acetyl-CoA synthase subunit delta [Candidatus Bathyarchaeota archaeon]|nr:CO dehydrogenase/acetyl-CoA synthase subunit delta [Candidatus Bathyarchaeota archaeon]
MPERAEKNSDLALPREILDLLAGNDELELEDVDMIVEELQFLYQPGVMPALQRMVAARAKPTSLLDAPFALPVQKYPSQIVEVTLGATKSQGGSRGRTIKIGGEKSPAFYTFENPTLNSPVVSLDVFDSKVPIPKAVKTNFNDAIEDPVSWAKYAVDKFGAQMITLHLVSIDPLNPKPSTPAEAAKTVEDVLQAVDVPLVVGGCGDPQKDLAVFEKVTAAAEGERLLISTVTLDMDIEKSAKLIKQYGHVVLAFSPMDLNQARELNRRLLEFLPKEQIIMDTTTAALGYGLDYAFTIMERARLAGLMGDPELQQPMSSGTTNAWAAREAWQTMDPQWGDKNLRGPLWETVTGLTLLLAGVDLFMMLHPAAVRTLRNTVKRLSEKQGTADVEKIANWVSAKI